MNSSRASMCRLFAVLLTAIAPLALASRGGAKGSEAAPTIHRNIAPIVLDHCAACHHPGGSGPFSLLTYEDVKGRAPQIAKVTASRYMPPWLPEPGDYPLAGDCHLSFEQIGAIQLWVAAGCVAGDPADSPPPPKWHEGWQLGQPDLVVEMPQTYTLPPEGTDVWRKFIIPVPLAAPRYVRAVELRPGNKRIVHHAIAYLDSTGFSRRQAAKQGEQSYDGMVSSPEVHSPPGHFLSWLPGMIPFAEDPAMSWLLEPGTDLVVETHMLPSGKPEPVRIAIGLYFTDQPPTKFPVELLLHSNTLDIPAGAKDYEAADSYELPQDIELLGLYPHAHFLARQFEAWATLPGGAKERLLSIPHWDFNWQNSYRFAQPISLPRGTIVSMRFRYDNSADNPRNPRHPPVRVQFGYHSYDEMCQLSLQVLPRDAVASHKLEVQYRQHQLASQIVGYQFWLKFHPDDAATYTQLGKDQFLVGQKAKGLANLRTAVELDPANAEAYYHLGRFAFELHDFADARAQYEAAIQADPNYYLALAELGLWHMQKGNLDEARDLLQRSLKLHPLDAVAANNLGIVLFQQNDRDGAVRQFQTALRIDPNYAPALDNLRKLGVPP